jgi:hypothetical protein
MLFLKTNLKKNNQFKTLTRNVDLNQSKFTYYFYLKNIVLDHGLEPRFLGSNFLRQTILYFRAVFVPK